MLNKLNNQLKAGKFGVSIAQIGSRLYLVATLPPKPDSVKQKKYQQRISLGLFASDVGYKEAYKLAIRLSADIATGCFKWSDWIECKQEVKTMSAICDDFRQYWLDVYGSDLKRETTWKKDYAAVISRLPQDLPFDSDALRKYILGTTRPNTRTRKKFCTVIGAIARYAGLELNTSDLRGNYSGGVNQRELPTDDQILDVGLNISNPGWRWIFGLLATYGLRNHEAFFVDHDYLVDSGICLVLEGKTQGGKVWPFYPDWVDRFDLRNIRLPNIQASQTHQEYGQKVTRWFSRNKIPFNAYSLRHCWARRVIECGLDSRLAAKQMRHSHRVHTSTYNQWLDDAVHQREWERISRLRSSSDEGD